MKLVGSTRVMLAPETVEEAGVMQWLAKRFEGRRVRLWFDTTSYDDCDQHPMLWIDVYGEALPFKETDDAFDADAKKMEDT